MKKFTCAVLVIVLMLLTLVSCGPPPTNGNNDVDTHSSNEKETELESDEDDEVSVPMDAPLAPFDKTVVVNVMREYNPDIWFPEGEDMEDNILTRFYKEKLNIEYKVKFQVERGRMAEQLDLAIASNDLPDMFEANSAQIYRLAKAGQIQPIGEVYEKYASANLRNVLEFNDKMFFLPATIDGLEYGLPEPNDFADFVPLMYIRQDWLDNLNLEAPKTLDQLMDLCEAFVNNDPDQNGQDDTFAIAMDSGLGLTMDAVAHTFDMYPNTWLPDDSGELVYSDVQPGMKEVLSTLQTMYEKEYFDPEFAVKDSGKLAEEIAAGKVGILFGAFWVPLWQLQLNKQNQDFAEWEVYSIPVNKSGGIKSIAGNTCYRWLVVREGFEYPEAAIKGNNLWYELWQGEYSEFYHGKNKEEYHEAQEDFKSYPPFWFDPPLKNYNQNINLRAAWAEKDRSMIKHPEELKHWDNFSAYYAGETDSLYGWTEGMIRLRSFRVIEKEYGGSDPNNYVYSAFQGPTTPLIAAKKPLVDKLRSEEFLKFIMGTDLEGFDNFVQQWYEIGGQEITDDVNRWYKEFMK